MASFFNKLFGISDKKNYSELIPEPPKFSLAEGSLGSYLGGLDQLINVFQNRSQGQDLFDALKYVYEPQATELRRNYGIDVTPGDIYSQRTGALPATLASLNSRGLLDTGTSGIIEGQLRANLADELARSYGGAKVMQRQDIDAALSNLNQLFPQRFQAQNIQSQVDYDNALNSYNALLARNQATAQGQAARQGQVTGALQGGLGLLAGGLGGGLSGMGMFGGTPLAGGGASGFGAGFLGNITGQYNPFQQSISALSRSSTNPYLGATGPGNQTSALLGSQQRPYDDINRGFGL